jgi:tRNA-2-methylthio-N6-dimethylallyladenosine synthase
MNEHDSEKMAEMLEEMGLTPAHHAEGADVVVINTCSIREKAEHKVYSALGRLKALKRSNPDLVTVVAGCVAQQEKDRLLRRVDHLDAVIGTHRLSDLPVALRRAWDRGARTAATAFADHVPSLHRAAPARGPSGACSFVTIMQGCTNFCAYCVVPYTRGPEQSRPATAICEEIRYLADRGIKEVTLLGQNVNAYGADQSGKAMFVELLTAINGISGIQRIRFTTSHPKDFDERLIRAVADLEQVCPQVHLPLQSGSDRILAAMGRGYTLAEYLAKVDLLRELIPNVALSADMIVGFPGESDADFRHTIDALERIRFDQIFSFKYSPRPATRARTMPGQIPEPIKATRLAEVQRLQDRITQEIHRSHEGKWEEVLVEGMRARTGQAYGRNPKGIIVNFTASDAVTAGALASVRITRGLRHSLLGEDRCDTGSPAGRPASIP